MSTVIVRRQYHPLTRLSLLWDHLKVVFNGFQLRGVPVGVLCAGYNNIQKWISFMMDLNGWRWHKHRAELTIMELVHSHIHGGFWMRITHPENEVALDDSSTTLPVMRIIFSYSMFATWNTSYRHCKVKLSVLLLVWIWFEAVDSIWWLHIQKFFILVKIITVH